MLVFWYIYVYVNVFAHLRGEKILHLFLFNNLATLIFWYIFTFTLTFSYVFVLKERESLFQNRPKIQTTRSKKVVRRTK